MTIFSVVSTCSCTSSSVLNVSAFDASQTNAFEVEGDKVTPSCQCSYRQVSDIHAKARRKAANKKYKQIRLFENTWPTHGITANIHEDRKYKLSVDILSDEPAGSSIAGHGPLTQEESESGMLIEASNLDIYQLNLDAGPSGRSVSLRTSDDAVMQNLTALSRPAMHQHENDEMQRSHLMHLLEVNSLHGCKMFCYPEFPQAGETFQVFLNREASTLAFQPNIKIMGAYNEWRWNSFVQDLHKTTLPGDWWSCKLHAPYEAYELNFVFFDGAALYDNNSNKDLSVVIIGGMQKDGFEDYLMEEERREAERIAIEKAHEKERLECERRLMELRAAEEADRAQARRLVNVHQEKTSEVLQKAVRDVPNLWYFQPPEFHGGDSAKLFYNRMNRPLASCNELWIHSGYNNWQEMVSFVGQLTFFSAQDGDWWTIDVKVAKDAFVLNWVFADGPPNRAAMYDNNSYQDFHAIVPKGEPNDMFWSELEQKFFVNLQEERRQKQEVATRKAEYTKQMREKLKAKTKDILLKSQSHIFYTDPVDVQAGKLVTIFYNRSNTVLNGKPEVWLRASFNRWTHRLGCLPPVKMTPTESGAFVKGTVKVPLDTYMMDFVFSERNDDIGGVYDNKNGFDYHVPVIGGIAEEPAMKIVHISVEMAPVAKDIIHCHDWSSAPVAWLFKEHYKQSGLSNARIVFSIHNLEFGTALIGKAMTYADKSTTVSETYAKEVSGNPAISPHLHKFHGIRNGIDLDIWDPYNDHYIPIGYNSKNVIEGKKAAKRELQRQLGLSQIDRPMVGIITRLTAQKGVHLIKHAIWKTLERGGQVVLLGSAPDPRIQNDFKNLANQLHGSRSDMARLCLHYDEPLSHLIYAGSDFVLIPSMFEPCGLTQLIAMRYGAIPVVRRTGGLNDTVFDVDHDKDRAISQCLEPNGFSFHGSDASELDYALNRAISAWYDARDWFDGLCKQVMEQDWSWNRPALDYVELYYNARK